MKLEPSKNDTKRQHVESADEHFHDDIIYPAAGPFLLVHLAAFAAIWTGVTKAALVICVALYFARMFGVTAGYHRYFSHRSFRTSRVGQFLLALLAQSSAQRGVLWWAAKHREHHKHSDTEFDVHSPKHHGFLYAHMGWIFTRHNPTTDLDTVRDLAAFPELRFLDRHQYFPAAVLGTLVWLFAGWSGLVVGFVWSTVLLYHGTFFINSLAHVHGSRRYVTGDDSRNNWWLALLTMGEGWHNNHHAYMASARQGFRWWEVDATYYLLQMLAKVRIVWDLNAPPAAVILNEKKLGRGVVEKVARQLTASLAIERISAELREAWENTPTYEDLRRRGHAAGQEARVILEHAFARIGPTTDELRERALTMFASTPSMEEIIARTRELLFEAVTADLLPAPLPAH